MFIHGVLLRSSSRRRRRKMQGVDAGMQGVDDRMQAAGCIRSYAGCMQPACVPSVVWPRLYVADLPMRRRGRLRSSTSSARRGVSLSAIALFLLLAHDSGTVYLPTSSHSQHFVRTENALISAIIYPDIGSLYLSLKPKFETMV